MIQEKIDSIRERMCDEYCGVIGNNSLSIYARKEACDNCPLNELEASAEPEIIRCKDCKWWGYDDDNEVVRVCHAAKHGHMSRNWSIMIYRTHKGDFYCADAERRTDE